MKETPVSRAVKIGLSMAVMILALFVIYDYWVNPEGILRKHSSTVAPLSNEPTPMPTPTPTPTTVPTAITQGRHTLTLHDELNLDANFELFFARVIEDSRCPQDVQCIQAGQAVVGVELREKHTEVYRANVVKLIVGKGPVTASMRAPDGHEINLALSALDLRPYPGSALDISPVVTLDIKQLPN